MLDKNEHYLVSDEFIKNYQQSPDNKNGYVFLAWKTGHIICRELPESNKNVIFSNLIY